MAISTRLDSYRLIVSPATGPLLALYRSDLDHSPISSLVSKSLSPFTPPATMGCMQSTPVNEQATAGPGPVANNSAPASQHAAITEPEVEAAPKSVVNASYKISGKTITDDGVVYYTVEAVDGSVSVKRRYNDFKALYAELDSAPGLPTLPQGGLRSALRGKHNEELLQEREIQFTTILNAIAAQPTLAQSPAFQKFVTETA